MRIEYLTVDDVLGFIPHLPGPPAGPVRDEGLLASAVVRPRMTVGGEDAYPDLLTKAAAMLHSLVRNHPLVDGNKRLGWAATATFLRMNGRTVPPTGAAYDLVMSVAIEDLPVDKIAEEIRLLIDFYTTLD